MILDRELQRLLLEKLRDTYPFSYDFTNDFEYGSTNYDRAIANLYYLQSHGLVTEKSVFISQPLGGGKGNIQFGLSEITHKGMDFLADDGGLSAILGVVTIKIEAEQLRTILESKILASDLSPADKQKLIDVLRAQPAESIKHLTTKIVDEGWDGLGSLMSLIQSTLF